ncbi:MAG: hypothetical protein ACTICE_04625, partial [Psychrobacter celer]
MNAGIAYVTAKAGIEVVLLDTDHWIGSGQYAPQAVYRAAFISTTRTATITTRANRSL